MARSALGAAASLFTTPIRGAGALAERAGKALNLPELGISEILGSHNNKAVPLGTIIPDLYSHPSQNSVNTAGNDLAGGVGSGAGGGGGSSYGSSYASYNPNLAPDAVANARNQAAATLAQLNDVYNNLFGQVDTLTANRRAALDQNYGQQTDNLNKSFTDTTNSINNIDAAAGRSNSSYNAKNLGQATDTYNQNLNAINQDKQARYADLGRFNANTKNQLGASRPQVDLSQYNDVNALTNLHNQLGEHIRNLQNQATNLQTDAQLNAQLNQIAPAQNQGADVLQKQLSTLAASSAPPSAKLAIAKGYIASQGFNADDPQWLQYFLNLQQPQLADQKTSNQVA